MPEPRDPLLKVLIHFVLRAFAPQKTRHKIGFEMPSADARRGGPRRALGPPGERRYVHSGLESLKALW